MGFFDLFKKKQKKEGVATAVIKDMSSTGISSFKPDIFDIKTIETPGNITRVDPCELEQGYISDPIYFSSVNKHAQLIMSAGYEYVGSATEIKVWEEFFDNIGNVGDDMTWDEMLEQIYKYQDIYGKAFILPIMNKNRSKVIDLLLLDPKKVDYAKDSSNNVLLDGDGKPLGYVVQLPGGAVETLIVQDKAPDQVHTPSSNLKTVFLKYDRIIQYKLFTFGDGLYPIGLIEPSYISVVRKMMIEEAQASSVYQRGSFPLDISVGDENHHPRPQDIEKAAETFSKIKHDRVISHPYWEKAQVIETKQSDAVEGVLTYLRRNQIASLGIPESLAIGSGEATNRATLNNQQAFLEYTLIDIVKKTVASTNKYLIKKIAELNKWTPIKIKWGDIRAEAEMDKAETLINAVRMGALSQEAVEPMLRNILNLPTKEEHEKMGVTSSQDSAGDKISEDKVEKTEEEPSKQE